MWKAWLHMWQNLFDFTGKATRKEYWLALVVNVVAMYVGVIPYALVLRNLTDNYGLVIAVYLLAVHIPVPALYFRRAKDAGWTAGTAAYLAVATPALSGLLVGLVQNCGQVSKGRSLSLKLLALSFGLFFYGGVVAMLLYGDPTALPACQLGGLLLATAVLIGYAVTHPREVLAVLREMFNR